MWHPHQHSKPHETDDPLSSYFSSTVVVQVLPLSKVDTFLWNKWMHEYDPMINFPSHSIKFVRDCHNQLLHGLFSLFPIHFRKWIASQVYKYLIRKKKLNFGRVLWSILSFIYLMLKKIEAKTSLATQNLEEYFDVVLYFDEFEGS